MKVTTSVDRLLQRLPPVWRYFVRLMAPWIIFLLLLVFLLYQQLWTMFLAPYEQQSQLLVAEAGRNIYREIGSLRHNTRFLANEIEQQIQLSPDAIYTPVATFFHRFSEASGNYSQIRWIDNDGVELVRVDRIAAEVRTVAPSKLQNKSGRYYVREGLKLAQGEVYFSPLDLNIEDGVIEKPIQPMVRSVSPVVLADGMRHGMVVINYLATPLLNSLDPVAGNDGVHLALLNAQGYWLVGSQNGQEWGFMYGRDDWSIASQHKELWAAIQGGENGSYHSSKGYWLFQTLRLSNGQSGPVWKLVAEVTLSSLKTVKYKSRMWTGFIVAVLLMGIAGIRWRLAVSMHERDVAHEKLSHERAALRQANAFLSDSLEKLEATQKELVQAEKLSSLGMMVAGVAHELNTPLGAAVLASSGLLAQRREFGQAVDAGLRVSDLQSYLSHFDTGMAIVEKNLRRGADLVKTFKRLAVDRAQEERRLFTLAQLVDDLQSTSWIRFKRDGQNMVVDVDQDIEFDSFPGALGRVLENLVNNAYLHGFAGRSAGEIQIVARQLSDDRVLIDVSDNGCGITADVQARIFDPFFTTARVRGGTGLGLHLVHQLVTQLLEGTVEVSSTPGKGTCFSLDLPLRVTGQTQPTADIAY